MLGSAWLALDAWLCLPALVMFTTCFGFYGAVLTLLVLIGSAYQLFTDARASDTFKVSTCCLLFGFIGLFLNTNCANMLRLLAVYRGCKHSTTMASNYRMISKHNAMASNILHVNLFVSTLYTKKFRHKKAS